MRCPACGTENREGRKFCSACGSGLAPACPSCGAPADPGDRFCGECGAALADAQPTDTAPPAAEPAAERRLVSVLFADLVGFTAVSEGRDAEDTRELLSRYFDACRRLIELYGGTVEKFIGDAVMAVWGTPVATEDDAERAVRAALDLVAAVSALGDEVGAPELRLRAGVLTGEAAVTVGAEGQGMVAGDLVNTASRVQSVAEPGAVLVGEATRRATDETIVYADAGSHELKGKVGLVRLWRALRVVSGARGALKSTGLEAPFVGRERELRRIKDLFHACAEEGRPHLVSITGVAGIGKSRLTWEFYKYFDGIAQITYWHRGRCLSYGEGVTYWALADMVRMRARIAEDDEPESAAAKLAAVVREHLPDDEERRFAEPRLAHLIGLEEGARYERDDLFAAWRLFFERLADVYPAVLVFEDVQWADASLLDFVEHLLEWSRSSPIFVVTLARPELQERRPGWGAASRNFTSMYLEPLTAAAMQELLTGLVPGLPEELRDRILDRAEGIPLYAVETVRMLLDRGALVQDGPVYRVVGAVDSLEVPETLHALIAARLDGLPTEERRLVQDASVLGKTFTKEALASLGGTDPSELEPLLASLVRKEVLAVQADPRSPEHGQFGFLQDLLRRVAYETLARGDRKARHLAAAAHLEATMSDHEVVEVVASHYVDAYELAPEAEDAAAIRRRAGELLARAGDRAASLGASGEARRYFEQAAALAGDDLARAELHEQAARMAWRSGSAEEARALFDEAERVFEQGGRRRAAARISAALAEIDFAEGRLHEAIARLEASHAAFAGEEPDADHAIVAAQLGRFLVLETRDEEGLRCLDTALGLAEALGRPDILVPALTSKGVALNHQNRLEEARILLEGALGVALDRDLPVQAMRAYNNLAVVLESTDRYAAAVELTDRALELARRLGDRLWEANFLLGPISSLLLLGRWDEALARIEAGRGLAEVAFARNLMTLTVGVHCHRGELDEARALLEELSATRDSDDPQMNAIMTLVDAWLLHAEGDIRGGLEKAEAVLAQRLELGVGLTMLAFKLAHVEALETAFALGEHGRMEALLDEVDALRPGERPPLLDVHARRFRARLAGDAAKLAEAAARFRELGLRFWLAVTLLEQAELTGDAATLAEARGIFEELKATPWLERASAHAPTASGAAQARA